MAGAVDWGDEEPEFERDGVDDWVDEAVAAFWLLFFFGEELFDFWSSVFDDFEVVLLLFLESLFCLGFDVCSDFCFCRLISWALDKLPASSNIESNMMMYFFIIE